MPLMPTIDIALASYNGEKYIAAQLASIFSNHIDAKTCSLGTVIVSDNLSSDKTPALVGEIAQQHPQIKLVHQRERGVINNFNYALAHATADYVMLSDQDDIWLSNKLDVSLKKMLELEASAGKSCPLLVFTDLRVVDEQLNTLHPSFFAYQHLQPETYCNPHHLFLFNIAPGCTMLANRSLLDLALPVPDGAIMHDWWLMLVASCFGKIAYVNQATMLYRQHGNNQVGASKRWYQDFLFAPYRRLQTIKKQFELACVQAAVFQRRYSTQFDALAPAVSFLTNFRQLSRCARLRGLRQRNIDHRNLSGRFVLYALALLLPSGN